MPTSSEETPMDQEVASIPDEQPSQPAGGNRKKRTALPLNLDDYEKRRSARSVSLLQSFKTNNRIHSFRLLV